MLGEGVLGSDPPRGPLPWNAKIHGRSVVLFAAPILAMPLLLKGDPDDADGIPKLAARAAGCVVIMALYWSTETLPLPATAMLPLILFPVLGVTPAKVVCGMYFKDMTVLLVGGLMVALAIEACGLHERIALRVLLTVGTQKRKLCGCGPVLHGMSFLMLGTMIASWFLSMWISNTATTAMLIPVVRTLLLSVEEAMHADLGGGKEETPEGEAPAPMENETNNPMSVDGVEEADNSAMLDAVAVFRKGLLISVAWASSVGGIATLTGTPTNLVLQGFLVETYPLEPVVEFATWMSFAFPLSGFILILVWLFMWRWFGSNDLPSIPRAMIADKYSSLGPPSFQEKMVLGHFFMLALLWITHPFWKPLAPGASDATVAITVALSLFIMPSRNPLVCGGTPPGAATDRIPACLNWETAVKLPWGVPMLLGGGFAIAGAFKTTGLSHYLGTLLLFASSWPPVLVLVLVCTFMTFATEVTSNVSTCTIMLPILAQLSIILKIPPLTLLVPGTISTSFAFMLPIATPPNAIAFSGGELEVIDMMQPGVIVNLMGIVITALFTIILAPAVFNTSLAAGSAAGAHLDYAAINATLNATA